MRTAVLSLLALAGVSVSAQQVYHGEMEIAFGYCTAPWGQRIPLKGYKIPFTVEPIKASRVRSQGFVDQRRSGSPYQQEALVYRNDNGDGSYFVNGFPMPSAADDALMTTGAVNARWQFLTTGIDAIIEDNNDNFLIRWRAYRTYQSGLGAGVSCFYNDPIDFGGRFNFSQTTPPTPTPGTYKITFDLRPPGVPSWVPLTFPQQQMYFAQQFREWTSFPTGEEPFRPEFSSVFSSGGAVTGSSQDMFWFDFDPEDGIYDETEVDQFDPGNDANFLLAVDAVSSGTLDIRMPQVITVGPGYVVSGDIGDMWDSDDFYHVTRPGPIAITTQKPLVLEVQSTSLAQTILSLGIQMELKVSLPNIRQTVELYRYSDSTWVQVDERVLSTSEIVMSVSAPGTPSDFVESGSRKVKVRLGYKATGPTAVFPWRVSIDRLNWLILR